MARIETGKDKRDTTSPNGEEQAWGTLEELLLACAVNRHGTKRWDSIAKEVQKRSFKNRGNQNNNDNSLLNAFTPHNCKQKYRDLRRRFNVNRGGVGDTVVAGGGKSDDPEDVRDELLCIVDELRKLRVEELKREVHRHDVSIVSLQLKVKRLEEERERSLKAESEEAADLTKGTGGNHMGLEKSPLDKADGEAVSCGGSDEPDDRSFNESNSPNHKGENRRVATAGEERESKGEPGENRSVDWEPIRAEVKSEPAKDCSSSGGSGWLGDRDNGRVVELEMRQPSRLGDPVELRESLSNSKREVKETTKQSSDMQSSASLSRRKRRCWGGGGVRGNSGDELGAEEQSPANKLISLESQPLIRFMGVLRSHKHGSVFERRLPSQKTEEYENLIRQHMDLETVQSKLDKGTYCDCQLKFYRDLLLIFTNAGLFYPKNSTEHIAAGELRSLINDEIAQRFQKPKPVFFKPDSQPQLLEPVVKKPRSTTTMIVCRRRSSLSVKLPTSESMSEKIDGGERMESARDHEEKLEPDPENALNSANNNSNGHANRSDQKGVQKKLTRERLALGNISSETSKNNNNNKKKNKGTRREIDDKEETSASGEEDKELVTIKKHKQVKAMLATKKQGVVNFLKRIKQNSPAREGSVANGGKEDERREEAKKDKRRGKRRENRKEDEVLRSRTSKRREGKDLEKEIDKRGVGRPPRRKAAVGVAESTAVKRKGEGGERESRGSGRLKNKSRR